MGPERRAFGGSTVRRFGSTRERTLRPHGSLRQRGDRMAPLPWRARDRRGAVPGKTSDQTFAMRSSTPHRKEGFTLTPKKRPCPPSLATREAERVRAGGSGHLGPPVRLIGLDSEKTAESPGMELLSCHTSPLIYLCFRRFCVMHQLTHAGHASMKVSPHWPEDRLLDSYFLQDTIEDLESSIHLLKNR